MGFVAAELGCGQCNLANSPAAGTKDGGWLLVEEKGSKLASLMLVETGRS